VLRIIGLLALFPPRKPGFFSRPDYVVFVVYEV
jgi:hypothetical protein